MKKRGGGGGKENGKRRRVKNNNVKREGTLQRLRDSRDAVLVLAMAKGSEKPSSSSSS